MSQSKPVKPFELPCLARAAFLILGAHASACAVDIADAPMDSEVAATSQGLYFVGLSAGTEWTQVGQWDTYTNWEQDVVIVERGDFQTARIDGAMVFGPAWSFYILALPNGKYQIVFQMDQAAGVQPAPGGSCTKTLCSIDVPDPVGKTVRLMLIKSNRTDGTDLWWSAWARIGNQGYYVGQLKTPYQGAIIRASNWTSGWSEQPGDAGGPGPVCPNPPRRTALVYGAPTVSSPALSARKLPFRSATVSGCAGPGRFAGPFFDGAIHVFGP